MAWLENGLAMMLVLGVASGGGTGLSVRKSGWMCASLQAGLGGREMSGIILGGRVSSSSSSGSSERNGPSRARAGVVGRLPGMGSNVVPRDGAVCTIASRADRLTLLVSQLSKPSDCETLPTDSAWEYTLAARVKEGRLMSVVREVAGRTTWRNESRKDWRDFEDRWEKVGEGSAASGEDGCVASIMYRFLLGCELRMSDMTESRGPETSTVWTLGAGRFQREEVKSIIWLMQDNTQRAMCADTTADQLVTGPGEDNLRTSSHFALIHATRMRLRIIATADKEMVDPVSALDNAELSVEEPLCRTD